MLDGAADIAPRIEHAHARCLAAGKTPTTAGNVTSKLPRVAVLRAVRHR